MQNKSISAVLFDVDGTLIDTAPDVIYAINEMLKQRNLKTFKQSELRFLVSEGAEALLYHAIGESNESLLNEFRDFYTKNINHKSRLFHGTMDVLFYLKARNFKTGVVTNKPERLAEKLINLFGLRNYFDCFIYGDTIEKKKPNPEPLLHAAKMLNLNPSNCMYVGDHKNDMIASKSAGMYSVVAEYGYLHPSDDIKTWHADASITSIFEIMKILEGKQV